MSYTVVVTHETGEVHSTIALPTLAAAVACVLAQREEGDGSFRFDAFHPNGRQVTRGDVRRAGVAA